MNRCRQKSHEGGFSLLEVLLAILAVTLFLMGTLQLTVIAAWYKLLSKQQANANLWIQTDIEEIQALAANLPENGTLCKATATDTPNYASTLRDQITSSSTILPGSTPKSLLGGSSDKLYEMIRVPQPITNPNVLEIKYEVKEKVPGQTSSPSNPNPNPSLAKDTVVVIPPASFKC